MKKEICFLVSAILLLSSPVAYGQELYRSDPRVVATDNSTSDVVDTETTTTGAVEIATTKTTSPAISLSLVEAVKIMQTTGTRAETANLNKQTDIALAKGYGETAKSISKVLDGLDLLDKYYTLGAVSSTTWAEKNADANAAGASVTNKKIMALRRDFANGQVDNNYQADMNQIEYDTLTVYNGVLLAQENLKTEQDNLKTQKDILNNTKVQYEVGMLAKKDVLSAQSAVVSAQSSVRTAETKLELAKMSFNFLLGYSALQDVTFKDQLAMVSFESIDIEASVKNALDKRNEIKGANFAVQVHQILLDSLDAYPKSSSKYLEEKIALMQAEKLVRDVPVQIEIDVRNKASELEDKATALEAAKALQAYAQEGYRLIRISYDAGMSTLTELQQAQGNVYKTGLGVSAAISDYNLAYYDFLYAQDVGTERLSL